MTYPLKMRTSTKIQCVCYGLLILALYYKPYLVYVLLQIVMVGGMVVGLYQKNTNLMCKSKKSLFGRTAIVTGGTTGMGLEIAADFAHRGAKVIIACPFKDEGLHAKKLIERSSGSDKIIFKLLDLSSFTSIRRFVADILETEDRLDLLINNAGVGVPDDFLTADGLPFIIQVNYFGTFLLTVLLLPLLKKTGAPSEPSRIVNTASILHKFGKVDFEKWHKIDNNYSKMRKYGTSKLALVMFTRELSVRLKDSNVIVNVVDPGAVGTAIFKSSGRNWGTFFAFMIGILFKHPWEGAQTALYVSLSSTVGKMSGKYFKNLKVALPAAAANNEEVSKRLWDETVNLVKLKDEELRCIS
ncbi:retinol dehydrogenase 13-like [Ostrinia nubilalis]|uniref:retinol dehydrogenase 13-like n=1 Tax=Ostrinia nubilalis TaxID=29057 RepID=UPI003082521B